MSKGLVSSLNEDWWLQILCGSEGDLHAPSSTENYLLLPNASDPRVVVDTTSERAIRDALHRYLALGTRTGALAGPLAGGFSKVFGKRRRVDWRVSANGQTLREHLSEILGTDIRLSIAVGRPRLNRKPIVRCYRGAELVAVAKMGPDAHTAAMVVNEGDWLEKLAKEPLRDVATPEVRYRGTFGTSELLVTNPFVTTNISAQELGTIPLSLTRALTARFATGEPVVDGPWWTDLRARLDGPDTQNFVEIIDELSEDETCRALQTSLWHGDWSPYNIGTLEDGRHIIWDWERAAVGVPSGLDLLHMHCQYGDGLGHAGPGLEQLGIEKASRDCMEIVYTLEIVARHLEADMFYDDRRRKLEHQTQELLGKSRRSRP